MCTGHGCFPPRRSTGGSSDVFVNGIAIHRLGDSWAIHCCSFDCHPGVLSSASGTVFANGSGVGRVGDNVSCGSRVATGSSNVFAGG